MDYKELVRYRGEEGAKRIVSMLSCLSPEEEKDLIKEGEFNYLDDSCFADKCEGHSGWVVYMPSCNRAAVVWNGDPTWYDASSLEDAEEVAGYEEELEARI